MRVGLFVPCYVDQFYPDVALATVELLEQHGVEIEFPRDQTCCGQPMANTGCKHETRPLAMKFLKIFRDYPYVVCPSGSCVAMVRLHYTSLFADESAEERAALRDLQHKTFELCEFLYDVLEIQSIEGRFPHRVGLHEGCHGLRGLRLGSSSEVVEKRENKVRSLLESLDGIELTKLERPDECCGFGGTFSVTEEAVSAMMGEDRIRFHEKAGTEVLTSVDMSCLMHLDGILRRAENRGQQNMRVMHVSEILMESR